MNPRRDKENRRFIRLRLALVGLAFLGAFLVLVGRAVDLQVFDQKHLEGLAQREFMKQAEVAPRRGIIFDRNQEELAVSLDTDSVFSRPLTITTPISTGRKLAKALDLPVKKVIKTLKSERRFVWVARRVSPQKAKQVRELKLTGVGLVKEPRRFYPYTSLACHVLGFAGLDARGLEGLEQGHDRVLRGRIQKVTSMRDALGRTIHLTPSAFTSLPEGNHLILTLDKGLQYQTEKILAATVARFKAKAGQAVVLIPQTGEILAMASVPAFNPNVFGRFPRDFYRNRVITDTYEPGSTFKAFVAAAALISHKVDLEKRFDCENGKWRVGGRTIHDTHPHGLLNLADIIKFSSNIGAAKVGQLVGAEDLYKAFRAFGFGQDTGVDLPGESPGILRRPGSWRSVDLANICFGQGLAVTPLQLALAMAAVANGGVLMKPFVVRAEVDQQARLLRETHPRLVRRVMTTAEAKLLTAMLTRVTETGGTGVKAQVPPFAVAGKTGTAQKLNPKGGYSHKDFIASFVGFLPADDPKVVVVVTIDTPRGQHYGGVVAGPAFAQIARTALYSLGMRPPSQESQLIEAKAETGRQAMEADAAPDGPPPASSLAAGLAPNLAGMSLREVIRLGVSGKFLVRASGWGRVVSQNPAPGQPMSSSLSVRLEPAGGGA